MENNIVCEFIEEKPKRQIKKCEHGKQKRYCKECKGSEICEHGRHKRYCKQCGGISICEHEKRKSRCKQCGGIEICEHGTQKFRCKQCGGISICQHRKRKSICKICYGSELCQHKRRKTLCKICGGSQICEHGRQKSQCKPCCGASICEHGKRKSHCKICGGSSLCKSTWCETYANKKYNGYCLRCCINLFPETEVSRNYKTKEKDVVDRIIQWKPEFTWVQDKRIQDGCSKRRPDLLLDMGTHIIIVEIDENKHTGYSCENRRNMELSQDLQHRPIIFIRFNPDSYMTSEGIKITSCWKTNKLGVFQVPKSKQKEWEHRIEILKCQIEYWTKTTIEKTIEIVELFYC